MQAANLLESPLTMLTLVPDPSPVADARPVDALPRQTALVTLLGRRGFAQEDTKG